MIFSCSLGSLLTAFFLAVNLNTIRNGCNDFYTIKNQMKSFVTSLALIAITVTATNQVSYSQTYNKYAGKSYTDPKAGWYSKTQQYSPNLLQYKVLVTAPVYAICSPDDDVQFLFSQKKGGKIHVKIHMANGPASTELAFRFGSLGRCDIEGSEFNPLREVDKKGKANPY